MGDTKEQIVKKFQAAYCPEGQEKDNPVLEYAKYIVFERFNEVLIERPEKFGGNLLVKSYDELRDLFARKEIHPLDLKKTIANYIDKAIEPVRKHFETNKKAKALQEKVRSFEITR